MVDTYCTIVKDWEEKSEIIITWESMIHNIIPKLNNKDLSRISLYINKLYKKLTNNYTEELSDLNLQIITSHLFIFSKLDLSKIYFTDEENNTISLSIRVSMEQLRDLQLILNVNATEMLFNALNSECINWLNKKIDEGKNIYINNLIQSVEVNSEGGFSPELVLKMNIIDN